MLALTALTQITHSALGTFSATLLLERDTQSSIIFAVFPRDLCDSSSSVHTPSLSRGFYFLHDPLHLNLNYGKMFLTAYIYSQQQCIMQPFLPGQQQEQQF